MPSKADKSEEIGDRQRAKRRENSKNEDIFYITKYQRWQMGQEST